MTLEQAGSGRGLSPHPERSHARSLALAAIATWSVIVAVGALALQLNHDDNVLTTTWQKDIRAQVVSVLPERWAFFTKSPREPKLTAYTENSEGAWADSSGFPLAQPQHAFGLNRNVRAAGIEIGLLHSLAADAEWGECGPSEAISDCVDRFAQAVEPTPIANTSPVPMFCGHVALVSITPSPWAFALIGQEAPLHEVMNLEVSC